VADELELIEAARAGSVDAFEALVHDYRPKLLRFLTTRCASFADAEDALQDTFLNAYRYLYSYDPRWRFSTWLYRIAVRNAMKLHQAGREELDEVEDADSDPLKQCIDVSERENLWLVAKRVLSAEVFTAMWMRYVEDMSVNDIALVLGRSNSWTKVNLMRGRQAIEADMADNRAGNEAYG